jgi:hypothetical protein
MPHSNTTKVVLYTNRGVDHNAFTWTRDNLLIDRLIIAFIDVSRCTASPGCVENPVSQASKWSTVNGDIVPL